MKPWLLLLLLLVACTSADEMRAKAAAQYNHDVPQEIEQAETNHTINETDEETEELKGCPEGETESACSATTCAKYGGTCESSSLAENGEQCFTCTDPMCPDGTGDCDETCGSCALVTQIGSKKCYACVESTCTGGLYDSATLCDFGCRGTCVATNAIANEICYECRGET